MRQGVGGYGLVYPQVCIAPVVYAWALKSFEHNKFYTLLGAVWSVSFWMVLNLAGYSIAIITSAIALVVLLFYRRQSVLPAFFIAAGLILAMVLLLVYVEGFRNLVLQIFEGTKIVRKIEDLLSTAEGETADSFATRAERYWWSLESCLQYPLIGGRLFGARIGGHSELLDTFAQAVEEGRKMDMLLIPYEEARGMKAAREAVAAVAGKRSLGIYIGPEGGFDQAEVDLAREAGALPISLGRRILRTETAGMALLAILGFALEEDEEA